MYETSCQSRFDTWHRMLGAGALGRPRGMVWGRRREEGSGWGTHVYLWQIHFDIWQNQYNIVKLNKIKLKKKERKLDLSQLCWTGVLGFAWILSISLLLYRMTIKNKNKQTKKQNKKLAGLQFLKMSISSGGARHQRSLRGEAGELRIVPRLQCLHTPDEFTPKLCLPSTFLLT